MKGDKYMRILSTFFSSVFQDFESFHRTEIDLVEDDIRLVLDEYISSFVTYELKPGFYTFKDLSEALFKILKPEHEVFNNSVDNEFDDITMKTKLVVRPDIIATRFDEKLFFSTILGFNPHWDYEHYKEYISQKIVNLSSTNQIHLKNDVFDGSVVNGLKQPILYDFVLDKPASYKIFSKPETIHYIKVNKSVLNTITFYLEADNDEEVNFNGGTLTFTL